MKRALILGGADCVWTDANTALDLFKPDLTFAINDIGTRWAGTIDWWVTLHPEKLDAWRMERSRRGFNSDYKVASHLDSSDYALSYLPKGATSSGSSGLFAARLARELGCTHIVLAGVPMDPVRKHFFDTQLWNDCLNFRQAWEVTREALSPYVRSCSGWTRDLFGPPATGWLKREPPSGGFFMPETGR